jgi:uncharacterized repeat protein (TIGR04138 family)
MRNDRRDRRAGAVRIRGAAAARIANESRHRTRAIPMMSDDAAMSTISNPAVQEPYDIEERIRAQGRYPLDAYRFLHAGLERAVRQIHGNRRIGDTQHVTGAQLCESLRDLAIEQWGMLASTVLRRWGIHSTRDFGEMVFFLVRLGVWGSQESDRIEDFDDVFDIHGALQEYTIPGSC